MLAELVLICKLGKAKAGLITLVPYEAESTRP